MDDTPRSLFACCSMVFFGMGYLVYKHQLLFVYLPIYESGGLFWPKIYRRWIFAMFLSQMTMAGIFLLKYAHAQMYMELVLMGLTLAFKTNMETHYTTSTSVSAHLPLELAQSLDNVRMNRRSTVNGMEKQTIDDGEEYDNEEEDDENVTFQGSRRAGAKLLYSNNSLSVSYNPASANEYTQSTLREAAARLEVDPDDLSAVLPRGGSTAPWVDFH